MLVFPIQKTNFVTKITMSVLSVNDPESSVTDADTDESNGNFEYTVDLVKFIRKEFDDYFTIAVAGKTSCTGDLNSFSPIKFINIHSSYNINTKSVVLL